jgi:hypothetical protein
MLALLAITSALLLGATSAASVGSGPQPVAPSVHAVNSAVSQAVTGPAVIGQATSAVAATALVAHRLHSSSTPAEVAAVSMLALSLAALVIGVGRIHRRRRLQPRRRGPPGIAFTR